MADKPDVPGEIEIGSIVFYCFCDELGGAVCGADEWRRSFVGKAGVDGCVDGTKVDGFKFDSLFCASNFQTSHYHFKSSFTCGIRRACCVGPMSEEGRDSDKLSTFPFPECCQECVDP